MDSLLLIGRIILGGFFIYSGVNHFVGFGMMTQYAKMKGVPFPAVAQGATGLMLLLEGDALELEWPRFNRFISNLPYSISSPLIFKLLDYEFKRGVIMVQKEFAERMAAKAGSDDYSRLSVNAYYRAKCEILEHVPRSRFWPQPEVDSSVVLLEPRAAPFKVLNERFYLTLVNLLFQHRRKKISTILKITGQATKEVIPSLPYADLRVETLTPEQIGELADAIVSSRK